jgi:drug/metabolite transporter (DMT)-like permease
MKPVDVAELIALAALWGASFLFTRIAVPAFGPYALAEIRVAIAALILLPLAAWSGSLPALRQHPGRFLLLGAVNTAFPFALFAYAALTITAGMASIVNAAAPMFAAAIAWIWLRDRLTVSQSLGLLIGLIGVIWLAGGWPDFGPHGSGWALAAALLATLSYGYSANVAKRYFSGVPPTAVAAGSQAAAALWLAPFALMFWPSQAIANRDWWAVVALGVLCTGVAYLLYFRLLARIGPARAITVTFLIPVFAMIWGGLVLSEAVTASMAVGCLLILAGTALATGLLSFNRRAAAPPAS